MKTFLYHSYTDATKTHEKYTFCTGYSIHPILSQLLSLSGIFWGPRRTFNNYFLSLSATSQRANKQTELFLWRDLHHYNKLYIHLNNIIKWKQSKMRLWWALYDIRCCESTCLSLNFDLISLCLLALQQPPDKKVTWFTYRMNRCSREFSLWDLFFCLLPASSCNMHLLLTMFGSVRANQTDECHTWLHCRVVNARPCHNWQHRLA